MKKMILLVLLASSQAFAYQVTGPVLEVTESKIVVQKGKEKWEIAKDASTKAPDVKVGDKVTVEYKMTATDITAKPTKKK